MVLSETEATILSAHLSRRSSEPRLQTDDRLWQWLAADLLDVSAAPAGAQAPERTGRRSRRDPTAVEVMASLALVDRAQFQALEEAGVDAALLLLARAPEQAALAELKEIAQKVLESVGGASVQEGMDVRICGEMTRP